MLANQTFVTQLLQLYHGNKPVGAGPIDLPTIDQVKFLCDAGLGPIAFKVYKEELIDSDLVLYSVLKSADLTTRAIYRQQEKAAVELTRELQGAGVVPTFLKGISTSEEFYTPPYLRLMSDIDILIKRSEVDLVTAKVADLGYVITDEQWRMYRKNGAHHLPEARHPVTGVTIEVHTGLFAQTEFYSGEYVFQPDCIAGQNVEFDYRGTRAARFTPEFQLIYTLSKWSVDESWAVKLTSINDTIHILKKYEPELDWPTLLRWFAASPHLLPITVALLHYLEQADIVAVPPLLRESLADADRKHGPRKLKLLTWLLHTYPFNARDKFHGGFSRWCAHSLWLHLTNPNSRDLGITSARLHRFYMSALYGKSNPFRSVKSGLNALVYRIRK